MRPKSRHLAACAATLAVLLALPVTGASASTAALRARIKSAATQLLARDARLQSEIENYANPEYSTGTPAEVEGAIGEELSALRALRSEVTSLRVGARHRLLRLGRTDMLVALGMLSGAYEALSSTFASPSVTPKLARRAFRSQRGGIRTGVRKLRRGAGIVR